MKKVLYLFILIVCCSIVLAREYPVMTITDCASSITVNVTSQLPMDTNEYSMKGCIENTTNLWRCNCINNVPIVLDASINTINFYDLQISYVSYHYENVRSNGGGGGGSGGYIPPQLVTINTTVNTSNNTQNVSENNTITPPIEQPIQPIQQPPQEVIPTTPVNNTTIPEKIKEPNFFVKIWEWIKKILFYELW